MKRAGSPAIPETLAEIVRPARTALAVYGIQVGVLSQIADAPTVVANVRAALAIAGAAGIAGILMRRRSLPKALMGQTRHHMAMRWKRRANPGEIEPWFLPGAPASP